MLKLVRIQLPSTENFMNICQIDGVTYIDGKRVGQEPDAKQSNTNIVQVNNGEVFVNGVAVEQKPTPKKEELVECAHCHCLRFPVWGYNMCGNCFREWQRSR